MAPYRITELLLLSAVALWPIGAMAGARNVFVVITPPPARPQPAPQRAFPPQPPLQWAPPVARGPMPGPQLPAARCYAGGRDCPLEGSGRVGEPCTCGAGASGRALIPPSRDTAGNVRAPANSSSQ